MKNNYHDYRRSYQKYELLESEIPENPFVLFQNWFDQLKDSKEVAEINAMTVSTVGVDGFPRSRVVLLKEFDEEGFVFYTNYHSEKAKALAENPKICLSFFWPSQERQIIVKGIAEKTSEEKSAAYFSSRPRGSQLGALASEQSAVVPSREFLQERLEILDEKYKNKAIPKPAYWGGIKVFPVAFEFWQGRPNRLHDRIRYRGNENKGWKKDRLSP